MTRLLMNGSWWVPSGDWGKAYLGQVERLYWGGDSWAETYKTDACLLSGRKWDGRQSLQKRLQGKCSGVLRNASTSASLFGLLFGQYPFYTLPTMGRVYVPASRMLGLAMWFALAGRLADVMWEEVLNKLAQFGMSPVLQWSAWEEQALSCEPGSQNTHKWSTFTPKLKLEAHISVKLILTRGAKSEWRHRPVSMGMVVTWHYRGKSWQLHPARLKHGLGVVRPCQRVSSRLVDSLVLYEGV